MRKAPTVAKRTFRTTKGKDLALDVALEHVPLALVDDELRAAVVAGVLVGLCDEPCRRVAHALFSAVSRGRTD